MTKTDWIKSILPFFIVFLIDQLTKGWASHLAEAKSYVLVHFVLHHNQGVMLGLFSDLPPVLRVVSLSTLGVFLLCVFALVQYLLPIQSLRLRAGLSILTGGLIGNVFDRIRLGYVIDFITLGPADVASPVFNLADALQWVGYAMIVYAIIKEGQTLWPDRNMRQSFWVNRHFQIKYSAFLTALGIGLGVLFTAFSYSYMKVTLTELIGNNQYVISKYLIPFMISSGCIAATVALVLFAVGKYLSHRIAGPVYAFERFLRETLDGSDRTLKLRTNDEFKELEALALELKEKLKSKR